MKAVTENSQNNALSVRERATAARDRLIAKLHEIYGDSGYLDDLDGEDQRIWRFAVGFALTGDSGEFMLCVRVQISASEWANGNGSVLAGKNYKDYVSLIPAQFEDKEVEVRGLGPAVFD